MLVAFYVEVFAEPSFLASGPSPRVLAVDVEQAVMDGTGKASKVSPFSHEPHQVCVQEVGKSSARPRQQTP